MPDDVTRECAGVPAGSECRPPSSAAGDVVLAGHEGRPISPAAREAMAALRALPDGAPVIVSACLLGVPCRYDGQARPSAVVRALTQRLRVVPVCPEGASGLPTPRPPAEAQPASGRILLRDGTDVTKAFECGARRMLDVARESGATLAILKAHSPSCGVGRVYDGTFTGTLRPGDGLLARALRAEGLRLIDEHDLEALS